MLSQIIGLSSDVKVYGEGDPPYFYRETDPELIRLRPSAEIKRLVRKERNKNVLLKPLYDSQIAHELVKSFPGSKALWIFRHYNDSVDSLIKKYGSEWEGNSFIAPMLRETANSWKNEKLSPRMTKILKQYSNMEIDLASGFALFWLARNSLYFDTRKKIDIMLVNYEEIVKSPESEIARIFAFLEIPFKLKYAKITNRKSLYKPVDFKVDAKIGALCEKMFKELTADHYKQKSDNR